MLLKAKLPTDKAIPQTLPDLIDRWNKDKQRLDSFRPEREAVPDVLPALPAQAEAIVADILLQDSTTVNTGSDSFFSVLLAAVDQESNLMHL